MMKCATVFLLATILTLAACNQSPIAQYEALLEKGQKSSQRTDTLFMGISLGMTQKDFFGYCWQMNKKGVFTDGNSNTAVLYKMHKGELKHPASMTFYPELSNGKVVRLKTNFRYDGWAPWNANLQAGQLEGEVLKLMKQWFPGGNPFLQINHPDRGSVYVKVDNNRRIVIGRDGDMNVKVDFTDLSAGIK